METPERTTTPDNTAPTHELEPVELSPMTLRHGLSVDGIEELRQSQLKIFRDTLESASPDDDTDYVPEALAKAQDEVASYTQRLLTSGDYSQEDTAKIAALVDKYSLLNMSYDKWWNSVALDDHPAAIMRKSGQEQLRQAAEPLLDRLSSDIDEAASEGQVVPNPELQAETAKLTTLRQTLATLSATRQGRLFGNGGEKYQQAQAAYNEQVIKLGRLKNQDIIEDEALDQTQKNAAVIEYLFKEQNALRHESLEQLRDKPVSRFIEKFSAYMNRGSKKVRLAKNLGLGLGIGLVAGVTGGLGAGFAVAAGAGAVTARLARAYAMAEAKEGRGMNQLADTEKQALVTKLAEPSEDESENANIDVFDRLQTAFNQTFEDEVGKEQKKRRKSVGKAVATVAIAGAVGSIGHAFLTGGDVFGFGAHDAHVSSVPENGSSTGLHGEDTPPLIGDHNGDGVVNELDHVPEAPATPVEIMPDPHFFVGDGEGGIQLFESLGLDESNWYQVHQELLQNFPNDFYSMGEGQVGLAHSGQLSIEAQEFIKARFPQLGTLVR